MDKEKNWNLELSEYIKQGEPNQIEKAKNWETAIGLQDVDGLKPSEYLLETAKEHIEAHFLICYIALVLCRVLQYKLGNKYSIEKILDSLRDCNCSHIENNYYLFNFFDTVLKDIGDVVDIDFSKKYMRLQDIKKILAETKK